MLHLVRQPGQTAKWCEWIYVEAAAASHRRPPTMEIPQWSQTCDTSTVTLVTCDKNSKTLEKRTLFEWIFLSQSNHLDLVTGPWQLSSSENLRDLGIDKFTAINLPDLTSSLMDWFYFTLSLEYTSCKSDLLYNSFIRVASILCQVLNCSHQFCDSV